MSDEINYTIAAIPTMYKGRQYRSRLEARWAAFFDLLGWHVEYEPCDLGSWSPDFALWGKRPNFPIMVEVKPITDWHRATARKMSDANQNLGAFLLLVGIEPDFHESADQIGWLGQSGMYETNWTECLIGRISNGQNDMTPNSDDFCLESILWEKPEIVEPSLATKSLWKQAANLVQWKARK